MTTIVDSNQVPLAPVPGVGGSWSASYDVTNSGVVVGAGKFAGSSDPEGFVADAVTGVAQRFSNYYASKGGSLPAGVSVLRVLRVRDFGLATMFLAELSDNGATRQALFVVKN